MNTFQKTELDNKLKPQIQIPMTKVGSIFDGAYYIPTKMLFEIDALCSIGLSSNIDFEYEICLNNPNINGLFIDDRFNKWKSFLLRPFYHLLTFKFTKFSFSLQQSIKFWFLYFHYKKIKWIKLFVDNDTSLKKLFNHNGRCSLLKIDVEGSEYNLLEQILEISEDLSCMIIEFHDVDKKLDQIIDFIEKLNERDIIVVSTTINECGKRELQFLEMTFIKANLAIDTTNYENIHVHSYPKDKSDLHRNRVIKYFEKRGNDR